MLSSSRLRSAPALLFQNGEQGVWFDPSDFSTLFQDSAGTTPVTALGQPVGKMLDKSKGLQIGPELTVNGDFNSGSAGWSVANADATHIVTFSGGGMRYQSDTLSPILQVSQSTPPLTIGKTYLVTVVCSSWTSGSVKCIDNSNLLGNLIVGGVGTFTARITASSAVCYFIRNSANVDLVIDSISLKEIAGNHANQPTAADRPTIEARINQLLATATASTQSVTVLATPQTLSFKGTGTVTLSGVSTAGPLVGTGAGNRVSLTFTPTAGSLTLTVSGTVTEWQLQEGPAFTIYQGVVTATNYTDIGAPRSLKANGVNRWMSTASINFTGTDKLGFWAAVRKKTDVTQVFAELSTNGDTTNGTAYFAVVSTSWRFTTRGNSARAVRDATGFAGAVTSALSCQFNLSGAAAPDEIKPRVNGLVPTIVESVPGPAGSGNYGNHPLYLLRRGNATYPFSGDLHAYALLGRDATEAEIQQNDRWMKSRARIS